MEITLRNQNSSLTVSSLGAEPQSYILNGIEYIWCGDPAHWPRRAPLLFPMTGPIRENMIAVDGVKYPMPGNGFARDTEFEFVSQTPSSVTFTLKDSGSTRQYYPFAFTLTVTYTLLDAAYRAEATITAPDGDIWYTYGWHPAFSLDINGKDTPLDTYTLSFSSNENLDRRYQVDGIFNVEKGFVNGDSIDLSRKETDKGPIALWNIQSDEVTLTSSRGEHGVTATLGSFDTFVAWTPANNAQFICLEPMYSFGDASRPQELSEMYGITNLKNGESVTYSNEFRFF
ncbi:MAG: hypothetical protein ACI4NM_05695 [Bullifex sp.]